MVPISVIMPRPEEEYTYSEFRNAINSSFSSFVKIHLESLVVEIDHFAEVARGSIVKIGSTCSQSSQHRPFCSGYVATQSRYQCLCLDRSSELCRGQGLSRIGEWIGASRDLKYRQVGETQL